MKKRIVYAESCQSCKAGDFQKKSFYRRRENSRSSREERHYSFGTMNYHSFFLYSYFPFRRLPSIFICIMIRVDFLNELEFKYSLGSVITDRQFNPNVLKGGTLQGDMILEIPVQTNPVPQSIIDAATKKGITIGDVTGKVHE